MLTEILEQPAAITRTLAALLPASDDVRHLARGRTQVLFAARGSSDNAATYGRYLSEIVAGRAAAHLAPSVATAYRRDVDLRHALVVCLSQSGETAELIETQAWARRCGAATVAITNVARSSLTSGADLALVTEAGPELAVPATKTFTAQLVGMAVLARALTRNAMDLRSAEDLAHVAHAVATVIAHRVDVEPAVRMLAGRPRTLVTSRGLAGAVAAEVALKLEETCLRPVPGLSYADLRHGPIAMVDDRTTALVLAPRDGAVLDGIAGIVPELRARGAAVVTIGGDARVSRSADVALPGPDLPEWLAPIGLAVLGQLVVEGVSRTLGLDPDAPRGLRKITETDPERPS
ncbi:SIS domain-containing protein [Nocardioides glacieisoli]|uniref:SIS domain-containing protein n=2 Tax=Nocardioides glacieisoli TaxID=1168730 RepID=A0A4V1RJH2_9ACTN|nr:SIS domain-containing protein [Nocardioides glacieisoli]